MSDSTPSTREMLDAIGDRWPSGGSDWRDAVEPRLDTLLTSQVEPVARRTRDLLLDPASEPMARTLLYALQLTQSIGLKAAGWLAEDCLHCVDSEGRSVGVGLLGVDVPTNPAGDPDALLKLEKALDSAFGERRYVLWLRRALPEGVDSDAIGRAATLWLSAIDRGEWHGNHAVYEDDLVELELMLTTTRGSADERSQVLRLEPVTALERLSAVDGRMIDRATAHEEEHPDLPLVYAVGAGAPWRMPRGFTEQLLYGTADWTRTQSNPPLYEAAFYPSGRSLFSDPLAANICSIWWLEPQGDDPMGFRAWSHHNPWTRASWRPESPIGPSFDKTGTDTGSGGREVDVMSWSEPFGARK